MSEKAAPSIDILAAAKEIANGNAEAEEFVVVYWSFVHTLDDLVDQDCRPMPDDIVTATLAMLETVAFNPFVRANSGAIFASIRSAAYSWASSEKLAASTKVQDKIIGQILKSAYQETIFLVASIVGGSRHALAMQDKYRGYDFD